MAKKMIGTIAEWDADRGFGFLQSGQARVFLHRRDFSERRKEIELGDRISFLVGTDAKDRPCAKWA
jgi:cold shock CspA family protein